MIFHPQRSERRRDSFTFQPHCCATNKVCRGLRNGIPWDEVTRPNLPSRFPDLQSRAPLYGDALVAADERRTGRASCRVAASVDHVEMCATVPGGFYLNGRRRLWAKCGASCHNPALSTPCWLVGVHPYLAAECATSPD